MWERLCKQIAKILPARLKYETAKELWFETITDKNGQLWLTEMKIWEVLVEYGKKHNLL